MDIKEAIRIIAEKRQSAINSAKAYKEALIEENENIYFAEKLYRLEQLKAAKGEPNNLETARADRLNAYKASDADFNRLIFSPECKKCDDTGFCGGKPCDCAINLYVKNYDGDIKLRDFSENNPALFKQNSEFVQKIFSDMQGFSGKFPNTKFKNIVFMGKSGTGKTFLAGCVAKAVLKKGLTVKSFTANNLFNNLLTKYHTTFDKTKAEMYNQLIDCDLLIIDDLGTESIFKNITLEYFGSIINDRIAKNKHILITTNLEADDIGKRYDIKIKSRLFDKDLCYSRIFNLDDVRIIKAML